jgi:hypothetical protein
MPLTFLERKVLTAIGNGDFDYHDVTPSSRGGVVGSLSKKGLVKYKLSVRISRLMSPVTGKPMKFKTWRLVITEDGEKSLLENPPPGQRDAYRDKHGIRKLHGLEPIKRRGRRRRS